MKSRRILVIALAAVMAMTLMVAAGCSSNQSSSTSPKTETQTTSDINSSANAGTLTPTHEYGTASADTSTIELVNQMGVGITNIRIKLSSDSQYGSALITSSSDMWKEGEAATIHYPSGSAVDIRFECGDGSYVLKGAQLSGHDQGVITLDGDTVYVDFDA